jgi:hypothetical protein
MTDRKPFAIGRVSGEGAKAKTEEGLGWIESQVGQ